MRGRRWGVFGTLGAIGAAAVTSLILASSGGTPSLGNIWVDPAGSNAGLNCTRSSAQIAEPTPSTVCGDLPKAVSLAQIGDTIRLACGNYGASASAFITHNASLDGVTSQFTTITPVSGCGPDGVILGSFDVSDSNLQLIGHSKANSDLRVIRWTPDAASGTVPTHLDVEYAHLGALYCIGCTNLTVSHDEIGPSLACRASGSGTTNQQCPSPATTEFPFGSLGNTGNYLPFKAMPTGSAVPDSITIDDVDFHDENTRDISSFHGECIFINNGNHYTIRNSTFTRCGVFGIFVQCIGDSTNGGCNPSHVTIENNVFAGPVAGAGVDDAQGGDGFTNATLANEPDISLDNRCSQTISDWLVRYNSFQDGFSVQNDANICPGAGSPFSPTITYSTMRFLGNVGQMNTCATTGWTVDYNAWWNNGIWTNGNKTTACGTNGVSLTANPFTSDAVTLTRTQRPDYTLSGISGTTAAQNLVTPTTSDYALTTDITGATRNVPRDAGAYEHS